MAKNDRRSLKRSAGVLMMLSMLSCSLSIVSATPTFAARQIASASGIPQGQSATHSSSGSGTLMAMLPSGKQVGLCPLTHTEVIADVSGYISRVKVKQIFENTNKETIEAVYTFPLSDSGAVDEMVMQIGNRRIQGTIKKREEAREIYNNARANGHTASLLDQERTNIFTQSVANIPAGAKVEVTLQYVETLPFEDGKFSFVFPTVVGPRFIPGTPTERTATGTGRSSNTDQVPDASLITPPVVAEGSRSGHDISIKVAINGGVPISNVNSKLHEIKIDKNGQDKATVSLIDKNTIPNKDFVLTWDVAGANLKSGYLTHREKDDKSGYFTLMLMPPKRPTVAEIAPKEMVFVIDCSGSQQGRPIQKAKETLSYIVDHMNPQDTFQIIAFNNGNESLFEKPQAVSTEMKIKAQKFIDALQAQGGTYAAPAIEAACAIPADGHRLRVVTFMTDGYVGNDMEVVSLIRKLRGTSRWFTFGTGNSVNRAMIDGMAAEGGGEPDYVLLNSSAAEVGKKFYEHISSPVLTDVKIDFGGLKVKDVSPREVFDVWAQRPLYFKGRYEEPGSTTVTLSGYVGGKPYKQTMKVTLPEKETANGALGSIWARAQVDKLMREDLLGAQRGHMKKELQDEITDVALKHHIMTQFTSFVAVDESSKVAPGGKKVVVPTELPDGVSRRGVLGDNMLVGATNGIISPAPSRQAFTNAYSSVSGAPAGGKSLTMERASLMHRNQATRFEFAPNEFKLDAPKSAAIVPILSAAGSPSQATPEVYKAKSAKKDNPEARELEASTAVLSTKFDTPLQRLLQARDSKNQLAKKISIKVQFKGKEIDMLKALLTLGFVQSKSVRQSHCIVGMIGGDQLIKLAALDDVVQISLEEPTQK